MTKESFFNFHAIKGFIHIWVDGRQERLSLKKFQALPNILFNVDGSTNDYKTENGEVKII